MPAAPAAAQTRSEATLLAVRLDGVDVSDGASMLRRGTTVLVRADDLRSWRVVVPARLIVQVDGTDYVDPAAFPGADVRIDDAAGVLVLSLPPSAFVPQIIGRSSAPASSPAAAGHGGYIDYTADAAHDPATFLSLALSGGIIAGPASLGGGAVATRYDGRASVVRIPIVARYDDTGVPMSTFVGETATAATSLGGSAPFVGFRRGTDTARTAAFAGNAQLVATGALDAPSDVTIYASGTPVYQGPILPGPYAIVVPASGGGSFETVYRDADGIEHRITQRYLANPDLLRGGARVDDLDVGFLGVPATTTYRFDEPFVSASQSAGVTDRLTRELYADAERSGGRLGAALDTTLGGALSLRAGATAAAGTSAGSDLAIGIGTQTRRVQIFAQYDDVSPRYEQLGGAPLASGLTTNASFVFSRTTVATLATTEQQTSDSTTRTWSANLVTHVLGGTLTVLDGPGVTGKRALTIDYTRTVGRDSATVRAAPQRSSLVQLISPPATRDALSTAVDIAPGNASVAFAQRSAFASQTLTVANDAGTTSVAYAADGTIGWVGGQIATGAGPSGTFGLVEVPGVANARVYVNDQLAGRTNRNGDLFLANLVADQDASIRIEGADVPIDRGIDQLVQTVAPRGRGAFVIRFATGHRSVILHLDAPANQPFASGLQAVDTLGGRTFPLGDDGLVYLDDVRSDRVVLHVERDVAPCTAIVAIPAGATGVVDLGRIPCR